MSSFDEWFKRARLETLIRMKECTMREKDREDVRQLRLLLENPDE